MPVNIDIDTHTADLVAPTLVKVQEQVPAADANYVRTGAVVVGLNRLYDESFQFTTADFASPGVGNTTVSVTLWDGDEDRAESLATVLGVDVGLIYSAALCVGLEKLSGGVSRLVGPFVT